MGLALCAFFSHLDNPTVSLDKLDAETAHYLICHLETENTRLESPHIYRTTCEEFKWLCDGGFIWLTYIPRNWFLDRLNGGSHLEASFASDRGRLSAQSCGFRLVHEHDEEEFKQHCIRMTSLLLVNQETNGQQYHDGESEVGPAEQTAPSRTLTMKDWKEPRVLISLKTRVNKFRNRLRMYLRYELIHQGLHYLELFGIKCSLVITCRFLKACMQY